MGALKDCKIIKKQTKTAIVFEGLFEGKTFLGVDYESPCDYIKKYWDAYKEIYPNGGASLNGNIFECIIYTLLYRENIKPFYTQARVTYVPNIVYDAILYNQSQPVSLSLKTSLRERYKQADLEAVALKYVHRRSKCHLLTISPEEAAVANEKIAKGEIIGLDSVIDCTTSQIDKLIADLKNLTFEEAESKPAVTGNIVK
ncbi:MAG TPA: hypothetical protein DEQ84_07315 [Prevotellaceae bacterium]|nr:hypothetical protein [Prevotellaceae bacterium]